MGPQDLLQHAPVLLQGCLYVPWRVSWMLRSLRWRDSLIEHAARLSSALTRGIRQGKGLRLAGHMAACFPRRGCLSSQRLPGAGSGTRPGSRTLHPPAPSWPRHLLGPLDRPQHFQTPAATVLTEAISRKTCDMSDVMFRKRVCNLVYEAASERSAQRGAAAAPARSV